MPLEPKGCGRTGLTLTLYLISERGVDALSIGFELLRCGYFPTGSELHSVGMLLCDACAHRCGFPKLKAAPQG